MQYFCIFLIVDLNEWTDFVDVHNIHSQLAELFTST